MNTNGSLDCIVIGYNDLPFENYERLLAKYGRNSETYRDLRFSFVDLGGRKLDYCGLMNHAYRLANPDCEMPPQEEFKSGDLPNLAAAYLTNYLRRNFSATYINLFQHEKAELAELLKGNPLCVAITTTFYVLNLPVIEMVQFIRAHNPDVKVVLGGPLVGNHFRRLASRDFLVALEELDADIYVVDPQGERTLGRIVECLKRGGSLKELPNIVYRESGQLRMTALEPEDNSLDENFIDWRRLSDQKLGPTLQTRTARSCAFNCSFCAYPARAGKLTLASMETVQRELESMQATGATNVVFIDDTFNVPLKRFKELCATIIDRGFRFNWYSYFRCSNSDEEAIDLAARSGCKGVFLGIESGSNSILKNMNKAAAADQYRQGIEMLKRHGILTFGSFIAGFPGETRETFQETVDLIRETELDYYRIQLWYCEPGTPVADQRLERGITGNGFRWKHPTMTSGEAMSLIENAFVEIKESVWLPQWSFDFWIIPYLAGRNVSTESFRRFMVNANKMLALEIGNTPEAAKYSMQRELLQDLAGSFRGLAVSCSGKEDGAIGSFGHWVIG